MQERLRLRKESPAIGVTFPQEFLPIPEEAIKRLRLSNASDRLLELE